MKKSIQTILIASILSAFVVGCSSAPPAQTPAPIRALSASETALLEKIEALPPDQRQAFVSENLQTVVAASESNQNFGKQLEALLKK